MQIFQLKPYPPKHQSMTESGKKQSYQLKINSTTSLKKKFKSNIYGAINGVNGIINNRFISLNKISERDLNLISQTPGAALGSTRDKPDQKYCLEILNILKKV